MAHLSPSLQSIESIKEVTAEPDKISYHSESCWPSFKIKSDGDLPLERQKRPTPVPVADIRYDNVAQSPEFREKKNKYGFCKTGTGCVYCTKCDMGLCLSNSRNCFIAYHSK